MGAGNGLRARAVRVRIDARGTPIYHTNVLMSIGTRMAVVALEHIDAGRSQARGARLAQRRARAVAIDDEEMRAFAGNMLEVGSWDEYLGDMRILVMSATAQRALAGAQVRAAVRIGGCRARCADRDY